MRVDPPLQPQVVVPIFHGTAREPRPAPGGRRHRARGVPHSRRSGGLAELGAEGLTPWTAAGAPTARRALDREATTLTLETGSIDPLTGRSVLPDRDGEPQRAPLPGHGTAPGTGPDGSPRRLGRRRRRAKRQGPLRGDRHAPAAQWRRRSATRRAARRIAKNLDAIERASPRRAAAPRRRGSHRSCPRSRASSRAPRVARPRRERRRRAPPWLLDEKIALAEAGLAAAAEITVDAVSARETAAPGEALRGHGVRLERRRERVEVQSVTLDPPTPGMRMPTPPPAGAAGGRFRQARRVEDPRDRAGERPAHPPLLPRAAASRRPLRLERRARRRARRAVRAVAADGRRAAEHRRARPSSSSARSRTACATRPSAKSAGRCAWCRRSK